MTDQLLASRYRLIDLVATGGMGQVWRAQDELLKRQVAVKLLQDQLADDPAAAERFRREALTTARLSHPNMAKVFDYIEEGGRPGIVMELVDGETLATRLSRGPVSPEQARVIAESVLSALAVAHAAGIVHRDIKPGNILLTRDGSVKVTDFGIARAASDARLTVTGTVMGTAHYAAPEQVRGSPSTPASDLYGLGCVLYEMLTGRRPFEADTPVAVAMARLTQDPEPPTRVRPGIPAALEIVTMRALMRDPASRYASAGEMRAALNGSASQLDHTAAISAAPPRSKSPETTAVMPVGGSTDLTVALRSTYTDPAPQAPSGDPHPVVDALPPRWAAKRLAKYLLPLVAVAAAAAILATIAASARTVEIPNFVGMPRDDAQAMADDRGIELTFKEIASAKPEGQVLRQDQRAGVDVATEDADVTLTISNGVPPCCTVPNLTGMTPDEAKQALEGADLTLGKTFKRVTAEQADGTVVDQIPRSGRFEPGSKVDITLAEAPPDEDDDRKGKGRRGGD